jgi:membrane protease YdiL (CAAX protease family)
VIEVFNRFFFLIPYLSMILGLHVFKSAWLAFAFYHGLVLAVLLLTGGQRIVVRLFKGWNWKVALGSALFGLLGGIVLFTLAPLAGVNAERITPALSLLGLSGTSWLLFVLYHSLVNPWFEEALWRGTLGSEKKTLVLNDVLFSLYHVLVLILFLEWQWILLSALLLTLAAWLWRQLARKYKGLIIPVISHACADASIMFVVFWLSFG